jgi:NADH:ubiquinone oxidoreductase subunit F (NADH-binding)
MTLTKLLKKLKASGLRGRGGAGFLLIEMEFY